MGLAFLQQPASLLNPPFQRDHLAMTSETATFLHGVASGDPYADSVILWTRITPENTASKAQVSVDWEISTSTDFQVETILDQGSFVTDADRDWTVKVEAENLAADTVYYYRFRIGDVVSMVGQTKTLPVGSDPVRLAVFSCANYTAAEQFAAYGRAVDTHAVNPYDALVHLGDYIYEYGPGGYGAAEDAADDRGFLPNGEIISVDDYRQRYAQYHTDPNLQALRAAAPLIAIWDDHETANDSWSGGAENHQSDTEGSWSERRDAALKAYYEWLPIREPSLREGADQGDTTTPLSQGYRSFNFGDVLALHILETRLTARDEQLTYPDAEAVQVRIGEILADPELVIAYAEKLGITAPIDASGIPAFAAALAPAVTQELVLATVQQAWGDPNRDLIGVTQMAWLQQQMASSGAAWQVLGQQVLMQSMAVPAELLLNAGDPTLLDKYAAPLQKLATGTNFAALSPTEQALFNEAGKIPYNLDAWDGYGVERETILQTALQLGKRLISLAGDTHNAWAGVLDTMSTGTVAGVEFATPGVTSPGLEKYLPGADAYIRALYPAVDGLDGLFTGYVNGLENADLNRRGFLDLTVTTDEAIGSFQLLDGVNPFSTRPQWTAETVIAQGDFSFRPASEATSAISWHPDWRELDLVFGLAVDASGGEILLNPADVASLPRVGVQLADVTVLGSDGNDRIFAGIGSLIDATSGSDELFNIDSQGDNRLVGGIGADRLFLRPINDQIIGGQLLSGAATFGLSPFTALVDQERDSFLIDSSNPGSSGSLQILDYEPGIDELLIDGVAPTGDWAAVRQQLQGLNVAINAAPQLSDTPVVISLKSGVEVTRDLSAFGLDLDADTLQLLKLSGPDWISTSGAVLKATVPVGLTEDQLASIPLLLGFSDGKAVSSFTAQLTLNGAPTALSLANTTPSLDENTSTASRIKVADIVIADDNLGSNVISLSGPDAASFEVVGTALFLKAGIVLNFEAKTSYAVTLSASDPSLPGSNPVSTAFALGLISFIAPPPSAIWDLPGSNPSSVATWAGNPSQVDGSKPVQAGGIGNTWTTTDAPAGSTNQVVLSGKNNTLNVGAGQAQIQSIGQGNAIEAVQQLGDATKIISTGSFGAGTESPPPPIVNAAASTTGNVIGQIATIDEMAGGMTPGSGFYSYATGGTGNDLLYGSVFSDFFRGGMGNDTIIAYAGNDIVRGGAGSDQITLGSGNDTIYYTFDQLQDGDIDTVTDFNAIAGEVDILAIQADRVGGAGNYGSFRGFGTNSLSITDSDGSVTTVVAQAGYQWKQADIFFGV